MQLMQHYRWLNMRFVDINVFSLLLSGLQPVSSNPKEFFSPAVSLGRFGQRVVEEGVSFIMVHFSVQLQVQMLRTPSWRLLLQVPFGQGEDLLQVLDNKQFPQLSNKLRQRWLQTKTEDCSRNRLVWNRKQELMFLKVLPHAGPVVLSHQ